MRDPRPAPVSDVNEFRGYDASHEEFMRLYARSLPEDHRRCCAALDALKIGFGGIAYVARVLGMSRRTLYTGIRELEAMSDDDPEHPRRPSGNAKRGWRRRWRRFWKPTAPAAPPMRPCAGPI
jgi:hypothetical protein